MQTQNPHLVQKRLEHSELETAAIYMEIVGDDARADGVGAWLIIWNDRFHDNHENDGGKHSN